MPRVSAVSFSSTVCRIRRSPSPLTTANWLRLKPIGLLLSVTFTVPPFESVRWFAMSGPCRSCARFRERLQVLAPEAGNHHRILQRAQTGKRRPDDVMRVGRPERLREDVGDAGRLDHGPDGAARNDAGSVGGRLQQHASRAEVPDYAVWNRRSLQRHANEVLLRRLDA